MLADRETVLEVKSIIPQIQERDTRVIVSPRKSDLFSFLQLFSAHIPGLNIMHGIP